MGPSDQSGTPAGAGSDLAAALAAFNSGVVASREIAARTKRVGAAERKRNEAAQAVRVLRGQEHTSEQLAAAEGAYRAAMDEWRSLVGEEASSESADEGELGANIVDHEGAPPHASPLDDEGEPGP